MPTAILHNPLRYTRTILLALTLFFIGVYAQAQQPTPTFRWELSDQSLALFDNEKPVYVFNYAFLPHNVPENEPRRYAGDYVYPLYGLDGENLTDNAPKDHYHHHGVFWTWPGVFVHEKDGSVRKFDLWTSNTMIRQRFIKLNEYGVYENQAKLSLEFGWFVDANATTPDEKINPEKKGLDIADNQDQYGEMIMRESVQIVANHVEDFQGVPARAIDFTITLIPTEKPVSLQGAEHKSYGGFTIRFRPRGKIGVDEFITTDLGVAKEDLPETKLQWADYVSRFGAHNDQTNQDDALSGAAIFLSPNFPDFPPTWLTRYYGPLCVGFPGVVAQRFEPGQEIVMKVRVWIHRDLLTQETLQNAFNAWAKEEKRE
ncbi:MAG: PmoA family protein [Planctomycetia bacterium]|nr:PmoA family protein [Planctomycetia bacterium]